MNLPLLILDKIPMAFYMLKTMKFVLTIKFRTVVSLRSNFPILLV